MPSFVPVAQRPPEVYTNALSHGEQLRAQGKHEPPPGSHAPISLAGRAGKYFAFDAVGTARRFGEPGERGQSLGREWSDGAEVSMEVVPPCRKGILKRGTSDHRDPISRQAL